MHGFSWLFLRRAFVFALFLFFYAQRGVHVMAYLHVNGGYAGSLCARQSFCFIGVVTG